MIALTLTCPESPVSLFERSELNFRDYKGITWDSITIVQQNDGDAATTTPTDPEQTALRDTMGVYSSKFSLCTS
jgi:hypothetical protein